MKNFLQALEENILVLDGATGTMVQSLDLSDQDFGGPDTKMLSDLLVFSRPEDQKNIHKAYFEAGADAVETNTFGASPFRLAEFDLTKIDASTFTGVPEGIDLTKISVEEFSYQLSKKASELGVLARQEYLAEHPEKARPLFVMGSIGPSNWVLSCTRADLRRGTFDSVAENFYHQTLGLIDGGADVLLLETQQDILEVKAAVAGVRRALDERGAKLPIIAQVTVDEFARMQIFHTDIQAALTTIQGIGVDVFGINCSIGPDLMGKAVEKLSRYCHIPISVIPNAGLPESVAGETVFRLKPEPFAEILVDLVDRYGVRMVGGCCGTSPDHIRALKARLGDRTPQARDPHPGLFVSGPQEAIELDSSQTLIKIGERLNVRGSRKVKKAVEDSETLDLEAVREVVEEQVQGLGLNLIDVCMDSNTVSTVETLNKILYEITDDFPAAISIDSFEVEALAEAVKVYPGRPIVNSISLEEAEPGVSKLDAICAATASHDPIYIALCTGPEGPAATAEDKVRLATEILDQARERWGIPARNILVDLNVFPIGSEAEEGMNFQVETLDAIEALKAKVPEAGTSLGVGNLTMGLAKKPYMRKVLTSVFMEEARKRGLDAAIINPNHYVFLDDLPEDDIELARRVLLERDMDAFQTLEEIADRKKGRKVEKRTSYDDLPLLENIQARVKDGAKERSKGSLDFRGHSFEYQDKIVLLVAEALADFEPLVFINQVLMPAMQELGDAFGRGDASLPHLLKAADVMKHAMGFLEAFMRKSSGVELESERQFKGVVVLGTVYQDVHSIGKDLAKTLFENYGYKVVDLGVQTPIQSYLDAAKEHGATAIGASALLVQTSNHMITLSKLMEEQGLGHLPLLIGGAPVSPRHAGYVAMAGGDDPQTMRDNVFYCASAMDGVNILNQLSGQGDRAEILAANRAHLAKQFARAEKAEAERQHLLETLPRREIPPAPGERDLTKARAPKRVEVDAEEVLKRIDRKTLYGLNWKFGGEKSWAKKGTSRQELDQLLETWLRRAFDEGWIQPQGVSAILPCCARGDQVLVFSPEESSDPQAEIDFDVVLGRDKQDKFSAAQYFRPGDAGATDLIGFQLTTVGPQLEAAIASFKAEGDSESAHLLQGLGDRIAEDLADYFHDQLRQELGVSEKHGTRYSPGYPALRDMQVNASLAEILEAEALGVRLTEAHEFAPTSTTAAVVCFHPEAGYQ